jgi:hypothetical protein
MKGRKKKLGCMMWSMVIGCIVIISSCSKKDKNDNVVTRNVPINAVSPTGISPEVPVKGSGHGSASDASAPSDVGGPKAGSGDQVEDQEVPETHQKKPVGAFEEKEAEAEPEAAEELSGDSSKKPVGAFEEEETEPEQVKRLAGSGDQVEDQEVPETHQKKPVDAFEEKEAEPEPVEPPALSREAPLGAGLAAGLDDSSTSPYKLDSDSDSQPADSQPANSQPASCLDSDSDSDSDGLGEVFFVPGLGKVRKIPARAGTTSAGSGLGELPGPRAGTKRRLHTGYDYDYYYDDYNDYND